VFTGLVAVFDVRCLIFGYTPRQKSSGRKLLNKEPPDKELLNGKPLSKRLLLRISQIFITETNTIVVSKVAFILVLYLVFKVRGLLFGDVAR